MNGLGFIPDLPDSRDLMFGAAPALAPNTDLTKYVREVLSQGGTSSCVLNAIASGIAIRRVLRGRPWELISRRYGYYFARKQLGKDWLDADGEMLDSGCRPRDALKVLAKGGAPPESKWEFDTSKLNERPPWEVKRVAIDLSFRFKMCNGVDEIRASLARGFPVLLGLQVDRAFTRADGPDLVTSLDDSEVVGGHMGLIVASGQGRFTYLNSWTTGWRRGGLCDVSADLVAEKGRNTWSIL